MSRRGISFLGIIFIAVIVLVIVNVCSTGSLLPTAVATRINLPENLPDPVKLFSDVPTFLQSTEKVVIQGSPYEQPTSAPTSTPTAAPPQNGKIVYLGLDERIYSIGVGESQPIFLGLVADFHIFPGHPWYSPDGNILLVVQEQNEERNLSLVFVDDARSPITIGPEPSMNSGLLPRHYYEFSADNKRFLWIDERDSKITLNVIDFQSGATSRLPLSVDRRMVNLAAFFGDSNRILTVFREPVSGTTYLSVYNVTEDGFVETERLVELPGWQLDQFSVSPDGRWVALVMQNPAGAQSLYIVDAENKGFKAVLTGDESQILLAPPAWTPDGIRLLVNQWIIGGQFQIWSYRPDLDDLSLMMDIGFDGEIERPLAVVQSFSPDNKAVGFALYTNEFRRESFWLAVLDGSYLNNITDVEQSDQPSVQEMITGISRDWTVSLLLSMETGALVGKLYGAAIDGTDRWLLDEFVPAKYGAIGPKLSPDGKKVAYIRIANPDVIDSLAELCIIGIDGSGKEVLVSGGRSMDAPMPGIPLVWLSQNR